MNEEARESIESTLRLRGDPRPGITAMAAMKALDDAGFDIVRRMPQPTGRVAPVRVAVVVYADASFASCGVKLNALNQSRRDEIAMEDLMSVTSAKPIASAIITADIPIPETPIIAAEVEG